MLYTLLYISMGAILGGILRFFVVGSFIGLSLMGLPIGIFLCNVVGSFLMGMFVAGGAKLFSLSPEIRLFVATGFLGAFTTFSTFALETIYLLDSGKIGLALLYVFISVVVSVLALYGGMLIFKGM